MDPFIEGQEWVDFHHHIIEGNHRVLVPQVRPRYVVRVERRVCVERYVDRPPRLMRPDVAVLSRGDAEPGGVAMAAAVRPVECTLPMPEERSEPPLTIRTRDSLQVITVMEVLSSDNKRPGSDGRREYLAKRNEVLQSSSHLVEIDLLRGGQRMPTVDPLPLGDFYAIVSRSRRRPTAEVYAWTLRQCLPPIGVPLADDDPDVTLDLQAVFTSAYDRAGYDYSLDYDGPTDPALNERDDAWVREVLKGLGRQA
jgi:hypothetical protein